VGIGVRSAIVLRDGHGVLPVPPGLPAQCLNRNVIIGNYYDSPYAITIRGDAGALIEAYVKGNICRSRRSDDTDDWLAANGHESLRVSRPPFTLTGVHTHTTQAAYTLVLKNSGAITPRRDAVDERIVHNIQEGEGRVIDSQSQVAGWPDYTSASPPMDSDDDGLPDKWEVAHDLDPFNVGDYNKIASSGYSFIEEYINSLIQMPE
jgi:hypothetical protein